MADLRKQEWVVMFVDMVGSTEMKYRDGDGASMEKAARLIARLFESVSNESKRARHIKFTGDGAMVIFEVERDREGKVTDLDNGCRRALEAAERIILQLERDNLRFELPEIHIRIGITTGECYTVSRVGSQEVSGRAADLAARLCGEADRDGVLLDEPTKEGCGLPGNRFDLCRRRLSLKGVPAGNQEGKPEAFYSFRITRLLRPTRKGHFEKGLLALYPGRSALEADFNPRRLLDLARPGTMILVAGRTLKKWTEFDNEIRATLKNKDLSFRFLLSSETACAYLSEAQQAEIARDLPLSHELFRFLKEGHPRGRVEVRESDHLILDGITFATISLPIHDHEANGTPKLVVLQDLNVASGDGKATAVWACTGDNDNGCQCTAHGLLDRTNILFAKARELP